MARDQRVVSKRWNEDKQQVLHAWGNGQNKREGNSDQKENLMGWDPGGERAEYCWGRRHVCIFWRIKWKQERSYFTRELSLQNCRITLLEKSAVKISLLQSILVNLSCSFFYFGSLEITAVSDSLQGKQFFFLTRPPKWGALLLLTLLIIFICNCLNYKIDTCKRTFCTFMKDDKEPPYNHHTT